MLKETDLYFLTIVKTGNLSKAAQELYVSQPSLSKYIQRLEQRLGSPLFDRSSNPMQLNGAGKLYYEYLLTMQEKEQEMIGQIQEINGEIRGTFHLGIPYFCGQYYLPKVLPLFKKEFPNVTMDLHENSGIILEQALLEQKIDLAVLHLPVVTSQLISHVLGEERIYFVKKRTEDQPMSTSRNIVVQRGKIEDLGEIPLILPDGTQKLGMMVDNFIGSLEYQPLVYAHTRNVITTMALAAEGIAGGFVVESGIDTVSEEIVKQLAFYSFENQLENWKLVTVMRKNSRLSIYGKRFVELLKENIPTGNMPGDYNTM